MPKDFADLDPRGIVRVSTDIRVADDPRGVRAKAAVLHADHALYEYWRGLKDGQGIEARRRYDAAVRRAKAVGLPYLTAGELAAGDLGDILSRVATLLTKGDIEDEGDATAILGGEEKPNILLSGLVDAYEALAAPSLEKHSPRQRKRWRQKFDRAAAALIALRGDKALTKLVRADAVAFRISWQERVTREKLDIGTANKQMGHLNTMLIELELVHQLGIQPGLFAGISIRGAAENSRKPWPKGFIEKTIFADGALDRLNAQARAIVWIEADTGARPVEIANLLPETIFLDADIPFIRVTDIDRVMKTAQSQRDIPLVGGALTAMRLFPNGFPRYHDNEGTLSATINKFFKDHGMRPAPGVSNYSFRHSFKDRLVAVAAPDSIIDHLMGHKGAREKYGAGPDLELRLEWYKRIALIPPKHFGPL